jgi:hypothetical protein
MSLNFLELDEKPDFSWINAWQKAQTKTNVLVDIDNLDTIYTASWPIENLSLGESLAILSYLYEVKDIKEELHLGLDSPVWTKEGLKIIPSQHNLKNRSLSDFANRLAIDIISKWKTISPLMNQIFKTLQSQGLHGLSNIVSNKQLTQWRILRPIIPMYIENFSRELIENGNSNQITLFFRDV